MRPGWPLARTPWKKARRRLLRPAQPRAGCVTERTHFGPPGSGKNLLPPQVRREAKHMPHPACPARRLARPWGEQAGQVRSEERQRQGWGGGRSTVHRHTPTLTAHTTAPAYPWPPPQPTYARPYSLALHVDAPTVICCQSLTQPCPTQLRRPNVTTEDSGAWRTKRQKPGE